MSQLSALLPTDTASGDIASITDGQNVVPIKSLKVTLEPIQSGTGTPSPDNVRPISGWTDVDTYGTGINVWDGTYENGKWLENTSGAVATASGYNLTDFISVVPSKTYYKSVSGSGRALFYDADKNVLPSQVWNTISSGATQFTVPQNARYVRFVITTPNINTFAVNYPSTDHDYHAYNGASYTTDLGRTVYGGTLDVVSGELVVDRAIKAFDGSESWLQHGTLNNSFYLNNAFADATSGTAVSNIFEYAVSAFAQLSDGQFTLDGSYKRLALHSSAFETATELKEYLAQTPMVVAYPLATPQTYQLDPQTISLLHGNNNVWSDGSVELTYNADVGLYIDKKREAVRYKYDRMIAPTESEYIATQNYTTGSLLIVDGVLYKVTSNIANGGTITPNTNCTATTLSEVISALA